MSLFRKTPKTPIRHQIGKNAEKVACQYLQDNGLKLLAKNFHSCFGEVDLIMQDDDTLVFVEVRCRRKNAQVSAAESVNFAKIQKIRKTAEHYLLQFEQMPNCRFDVIAMIHNGQNSDYNIDWIQNAF